MKKLINYKLCVVLLVCISMQTTYGNETINVLSNNSLLKEVFNEKLNKIRIDLIEWLSSKNAENIPPFTENYRNKTLQALLDSKIKISTFDHNENLISFLDPKQDCVIIRQLARSTIQVNCSFETIQNKSIQELYEIILHQFAILANTETSCRSTQSDGSRYISQYLFGNGNDFKLINYNDEQLQVIANFFKTIHEVDRKIIKLNHFLNNNIPNLQTDFEQAKNEQLIRLENTISTFPVLYEDTKHCKKNFTSISAPFNTSDMTKLQNKVNQAKQDLELLSNQVRLKVKEHHLPVDHFSFYFSKYYALIESISNEIQMVDHKLDFQYFSIHDFIESKMKSIHCNLKNIYKIDWEDDFEKHLRYSTPEGTIKYPGPTPRISLFSLINNKYNRAFQFLKANPKFNVYVREVGFFEQQSMNFHGAKLILKIDSPQKYFRSFKLGVESDDQYANLLLYLNTLSL